MAFYQVLMLELEEGRLQRVWFGQHAHQSREVVRVFVKLMLGKIDRTHDAFDFFGSGGICAVHGQQYANSVPTHPYHTGRS